jgi:cyclopropane fatty-acyl-phospholipid synthase-like methyltransferase
VTMHLLDFSPAMHELARTKLASFADRVTFVERDFKSTDWSEGLGEFDAIVTVQAVHELRHKYRADGFHRGVKGLLKEHGKYLVCDHYFGEDGMKNNQLYMSIDEQRSSLVGAGFKVPEVLVKGGRSLFHAA